MYLFFDTETTGLPLNYNASVKDVDNWPRMISLCYALYDENEKLIEIYHELIRPDGWEIPKEPFWIDNGYTQENSLANGIPIIPVLLNFIEAIESAKYLIAHNMSFDEKIVGAEMVRQDFKTINKPIKLCTKELSTDYCQIQGKYNWKWPTLNELYNKLFGVDFDKAHNAENDVKACAKCFFELKRLNIIKL